MKKMICFLIAGTMGFSILFAQNEELKIPSVDIKTIDGKTLNASELSNDGKPIIISFWATWCKPCVQELSAISEVYEEWQDETGVKLVAVSIDDSRSTSRVSPFVNGKGWDYDILLDANSDLKKALNVVNIPHTFLVNGDGNIVWQHAGYAVGDEEELYELVKKVANGENISK
ncbi:MAG: TlpA disulfide reductase family protein [Bacteroidota bacterium]